MRDDRERRPGRDEDEEQAPEADRSWDRNSFLTGIVLGAAVGAGLALLLAPASGSETRRLVRRRARSLAREAESGFGELKKEARRTLRDKKEALRERLAQGLEAVEDRLED